MSFFFLYNSPIVLVSWCQTAHSSLSTYHRQTCFNFSVKCVFRGLGVSLTTIEKVVGMRETGSSRFGVDLASFSVLERVVEQCPTYQVQVVL